jgi:hypothetical protein
MQIDLFISILITFGSNPVNQLREGFDCLITPKQLRNVDKET